MTDLDREPCQQCDLKTQMQRNKTVSFLWVSNSKCGSNPIIFFNGGTFNRIRFQSWLDLKSNITSIESSDVLTQECRETCFWQGAITGIDKIRYFGDWCTTLPIWECWKKNHKEWVRKKYRLEERCIINILNIKF